MTDWSSAVRRPPVAPPPIPPVPPRAQVQGPGPAASWLRSSRSAVRAGRESGEAFEGPAPWLAGAAAVKGYGAQGDRGGTGGRQDHAGGQAEAAPEPPGDAPAALDPRVAHVGNTIALVCRHEPAPSIWSARVPLDPGLLPGTVLHIAYSPALLALRFETADWESRDLLQAQQGALEALVAALLPSTRAVSVTL